MPERMARGLRVQAVGTTLAGLACVAKPSVMLSNSTGKASRSKATSTLHAPLAQ